MLRNKSGGTGGFTLIEVVLTLTLSGTVLAILASSYMQSAYTQQKIAGRVSAAILGSGKLAELEKGSELALSGDFYAPYDNYHWFATEEKSRDESVTIFLTVEWTEGGIKTNVHRMSFKGFRPPSKE